MRFASKERTRFSTPTCGEERKDIWPPLLTIIDLKKKDAIGGLIKRKKITQAKVFHAVNGVSNMQLTCPIDQRFMIFHWCYHVTRIKNYTLESNFEIELKFPSSVNWQIAAGPDTDLIVSAIKNIIHYKTFIHKSTWPQNWTIWPQIWRKYNNLCMKWPISTSTFNRVTFGNRAVFGQFGDVFDILREIARDQYGFEFIHP